MKKGDRVVNPEGWRAELISGKSKTGTILVRWLTGPIKGREGRVEARGLKPVEQKRVRVLREGREVAL